MTLQQIKYVIEIANCGSMNEAAKHLFISQPSLSNSIRDLEEELGISIFERTNRGISISEEGAEFLLYAKQVLEQTEFIENRYHGSNRKPIRFSIAAQHYAFIAEALINLINERAYSEYEFKLKEMRTYEIIEDVKNLRSDIGILQLSDTNTKIMNKIFSDNSLRYTPLFNTNPHIFIGDQHPLADRESVGLDELVEFPYIVFDQGNSSPLYFSEEMVNINIPSKSIKVTDRATLSNLLIGTNSYTVGTGIVVPALNGDRIKSILIEDTPIVTIGWITHKDIKLKKAAIRYIEILNDVVSSNYFDLNNCLL